MRLPVASSFLVLVLVSGCDQPSSRSAQSAEPVSTNASRFDFIEGMHIKQTRSRFDLHPTLPILLDTSTGDTWLLSGGKWTPLIRETTP